jgi:hypothetical protein
MENTELKELAESVKAYSRSEEFRNELLAAAQELAAGFRRIEAFIKSDANILDIVVQGRNLNIAKVGGAKVEVRYAGWTDETVPEKDLLYGIGEGLETFDAMRSSADLSKYAIDFVSRHNAGRGCTGYSVDFAGRSYKLSRDEWSSLCDMVAAD